MVNKTKKKKSTNLILVSLILSMLATNFMLASDHGDVHRGAANIGDFYVFKRGDKLVLIMTVMADLPADIKQFHFPDDVTYRFLIDRNPDVKFDDLSALKSAGGIIVKPETIKEDVIFELTFSNHGSAKNLSVTGLKAGTVNNVSLFAGIRDEPFIRGGLEGRNVAAIVVELPLECVISGADNQTIIAWSTTDTAKVHGQKDLGAHPYTSQSLVRLNTLHPSEHLKTLNVQPDVYIYNTKLPAKYPNGRELADDVVDVKLPAEDIIKRHGTNPSENDVKFLDAFPYLAPEHEFEPGDYPGPPENKEAYNASITGFSLEKEIGMKGYNARLRYWVVGPHGMFGQHFHDKRPAFVYLLEGQLVETKKDADGKSKTKTINKNEIFLEPNGVAHWVANGSHDMVKMIVIDVGQTPVINRIASGSARTGTLNPPANPRNIKAEELAEYDLAQQFPEIEESKNYLMRARRITLFPKETSAAEVRNARPCISYVISGNVLEHRSDEETALRRAGECSIATNGIMHYWENPTSEPVVLFIAEFIKKSEK